jgi:CRISPR-associated protein Cas2
VAISGIRSWIIAYDIAEPRRLRQVHAYLVKHAHALQYSVFLAMVTESQLQRILAGLAGQINHNADDIRAYPVPENAVPICLGLAQSRDWLLLAGLPHGAGGFL